MDWYDLEFFHDGGFRKVVKFLHEEKKSGKHILPPKEDILNAFVYTPLEDVKVVIIGQDPYPTISHAMGLAFSVSEGVSPLPKSLINIFKELREDLNIERTSGDLTDWAKQGVLLLNTSLTVIEGMPSSHSSIGWGRLVREALSILATKGEHIVYILWGKHAQQCQIFVDMSKNHIIKSAHPSPLSAYRGFFGSKCFSRANQYLIKHKIHPIKW